MTEAELIARLAATDKQLADLQQRIDDLNKLLGKRIDDIGDYAGKTFYLATQTQLSTDRRLTRLEKQDDESVS